MADAEQVAMLKRSVLERNAWRKANNRTTPQLKEAALAHANLECADLNNAFAPRIILRAANLRASDLSVSVMRYGDFREADLTRAEIVAADLVDTQCAEANFTATYLDGVDFDGADLRHAVFKGAKLIDVCFEDADLSNAILLVSEPQPGDAEGWRALLKNTHGNEQTLLPQGVQRPVWW
ncbi:MAG: pentapeptide repeat-containing protein [Pseudomonadota bacterium]